MRIKRFEAKDSSTALAMIKKEMGDDAVILATKKIPASRGRAAGVEVVAAIDYDIDEIFVPPPDEQQESHLIGVNKPAATYDYHSIKRNTTASKPPLPPRPAVGKAPPLAAGTDKGNRSEIQSEAHDLRLRFANLLRPPKGKGEPKKSAPSPGKNLRDRKPQQPPKPEDVAKWRDQLIDKIKLRSPDLQLPSAADRQIVALVGATGVGKTTTAAKLAAWYSLRQGFGVCLLSMDCYRIGATDQLRTYARIMRLPCEVVLRKGDLPKALDRHANKLIIIDTAGKSPYDTGHIAELLDWFSPYDDIMPHLVLSANTKKEDIQHIIETYRPLDIASMILTKLDETRAYAALCHQVVASALPVSYLCTGQRVPEDFLIASKEFLDTLFKHGWDAVNHMF